MTNKWYLPVCICLKYDDTDHKYNFNIYRAYRSALSKSLFTNTFTSIKSIRPGIWHVRGHTSSVEARLRVNKHYWKKLIVQWVVFSSNSRDWECQWPSKKDIWTFELNRLYLVSLEPNLDRKSNQTKSSWSFLLNFSMKKGTETCEYQIRKGPE